MEDRERIHYATRGGKGRGAAAESLKKEEDLATLHIYLRVCLLS